MGNEGGVMDSFNNDEEIVVFNIEDEVLFDELIKDDALFDVSTGCGRCAVWEDGVLVVLVVVVVLRVIVLLAVVVVVVVEIEETLITDDWMFVSNTFSWLDLKKLFIYLDFR